MNSTPLEGILLVSDVDGTLITNRFEMPRRNIEAVRRFTRLGGRFALATGRSAASAAPYAAQAGVNSPSVLFNGAAVYDFSSEKTLWQTCLPDSFGARLREVMRRFPDVGVEVFAGGSIYILRDNEWTARHMTDESLEHCTAGIGSVPAGWNKVLLAAGHDRLTEVRDFFGSFGPDGWSAVFSNTMYYEVLPEGVTKLTAARRLAGLLGIAPENVLTIGDYYNDYELIAGSAFSAVPAGAPAELRERAGYVTCRCEEGAVADFIGYIEGHFGETPAASLLTT